MAAKPKARQGRKKKEDCRHRHEDGVCVCKGPGDGHVMDAREKRCGRLDGNALASEARTAMVGLDEKKKRW